MTRSIWYLGGNQIIKLLTSVDGDLDHAVLAKIVDVPSIIGDLALSVESLVSDDFTVGGFETELLAQIAANTLAAKRASVAPPVQPLQQTQLQTPAQPSLHQEHEHELEQLQLHLEQEQQHHDEMSLDSEDPQTLPTFEAVPNPLADYQPVPNPLARITPPASPLITMSMSIDRTPSDAQILTAKMIQAR